MTTPSTLREPEGIHNFREVGPYALRGGYGGQVLRHVGAWARVISPLRWRAYEAARRLRKTHGLAA